MLIKDRAFRLCIFILSVTACVAAAFIKGPSLDEFWTLIYTNPEISLQNSWKWWSSDTGHPIGYYALVRYSMEFIPNSVTSARIINLVPWVALGWYCLFSKLNSEIRQFCVVFYTAISGTYYTIERLSEARGFFIAFIIISFLIVEIKRIENPGQSKMRAIPISLLTMLIALFDYPVFCASVALLTASAIALFRASRAREATWVGLALAAGFAVALAGLANSMGYERVAPPYFVSTYDYGKNAIAVILAGLLGNLAISSASGISIIKIIRFRPTEIFNIRMEITYQIKWVMLAAIIMALSGYALLNLNLHALINRQLISFVPLTCGALAAWFPARANSKHMAALILSALILSQALVLYRLSRTPNFNRHAALLASQQDRCSGFRVLPIDPEELGEKSDGLARQLRKSALRLAYSQISQRFGFTTAPPTERSLDARCGGAVWILHAWLKEGATASSLLDQLHIAANVEQKASARVNYQDNSLVILVPGRDGARLAPPSFPADNQ